jgi:hypothetical protein
MEKRRGRRIPGNMELVEAGVKLLVSAVGKVREGLLFVPEDLEKPQSFQHGPQKCSSGSSSGA